jgi:hypothetical protein
VSLVGEHFEPFAQVSEPEPRDAPVEVHESARGDWMQTFTGRAFFPLDPRPGDIDILDIAHGLSMLCRYNGHVSRFYSVAEHCVLMSRAVAPENALWALLHDATEAYVGDMIRPLKRQIPQYAAAEDAIMAAICYRFGLDYACPAEVKAADTRILRDEREALLGPAPLPWLSVENVEPLGVPVTGWGPARAEWEYLRGFEQLTGGPSQSCDRSSS